MFVSGFFSFVHYYSDAFKHLCFREQYDACKHSINKKWMVVYECWGAHKRSGANECSQVPF